MNNDILKVERKNVIKPKLINFSIGNRNDFSIVLQSTPNGLNYLSLCIVKKNGNDDNELHNLITLKDCGSDVAEKVINDFKRSVKEAEREIFKTKNYININSIVMSTFKSTLLKNYNQDQLIKEDLNIARVIKKSESNNRQNNNFATINATVNAIQPAHLLEGLIALGKIQKVDNIENGSDEEIYEYTSMSTGQTYKTSVKSVKYLATDNNINHPDSNVYKHFRPFTNGGRSSFGLLRDLIMDGLDVGVDSSLTGTDLNNQIRRFIFNEIAPTVNPENLAEIETQKTFKASEYVTQKVNNYSRLPKIVENHQETNKFKRYFNSRGLSNKLIDKMIDSDVFFIGDFFKDNVKGESGDLNIKDYRSQGFFRITDRFNRVTGGEKLTLFSSGYNDQQAIKIHKINTHIIQGNSFKFKSDSSNIKGTFVGEAVIDALSVYELLSIAGENPDEYNYSSIQGINNLSGFLEQNFGIKYTADRKNNSYTYQYSNITKNIMPISDYDIDRLRDAFKSNMYYVNVIGDKESELTLIKVKSFADKFKINVNIINVNDEKDEIFKPEEEAGCYIDKSSFDLLMNSNGVHIKKDG